MGNTVERPKSKTSSNNDVICNQKMESTKTSLQNPGKNKEG